jgi:hypothetical protein
VSPVLRRWTLVLTAALVFLVSVMGPRGGLISAGATSILGDANVEATADGSPLGVGEANQFIASANGSVATLSIYLDSSNRSTSFELGLYADASGVPGALIVKGASNAAASGSWNSVAIAPTTINGGSAYWIARLSTAGGDLVTRVNPAIANADRSDTRTILTLPGTFNAGGSWPHQTSMYAGSASGPTPTPTPTSTPGTGGLGAVGDSAVEPTPDGSGLNQVEANRFVASASGAVTSLSIYLDATNRATSFALGLYGDAGGAPGPLITQGSRSGAQNGAWNTVGVSSATVTSGTAYWIARLSTAGGDLVTRVNSAAANADRVDTRTLTALPSAYSPGASYPHRTSMYAGNVVAPTPTPTPTPSATPPPGAFACTEILGFSQTGNWWSLQRSPNDAFLSVVDATRYQLGEVDGSAVWKWADPNFSGWSVSPTSPCNASSAAPDRVIMDVTESFWIGDACGSHIFDDCSGGSDTSLARVTQDVRNVVATIRSKFPSARQIYLKPLVGGPPGGGQCVFSGNPIRAIQNSPLIAQAIAQVTNGTDVLAAPQWGVRDCNDFYDDGQYVGHLNPANDAKPRIGQLIGTWFAARP